MKQGQQKKIRTDVEEEKKEMMVVGTKLGAERREGGKGQRDSIDV